MFSRYDLVNEDLQPTLLGLAYVSRACTFSRTSINEDTGIYRTASVAAHEIGHKYVNSFEKLSDQIIVAKS